MEHFSGTVDLPSGEEMRLDRYAAERLNLLSRSQIKNRRVAGAVGAILNGKNVKLSKTVKAGDRLELSWRTETEQRLEGEDISLDVLYEDDRAVVVNKPAGMVVHPGAGNPGGTLANALLFRGITGSRAGIVHRLDKDTSGVIIAARDNEALAFLAAQFKARTVKKRYAAIVYGIPPAEGFVSTPLVRDPRDRKRFTVAGPGEGKSARTRWRLVCSWNNGRQPFSLLIVRPRTGRTHQIRVHLKSTGCPVAGDSVYGPGGRASGENDTVVPGLMLHAWSLEILLPGHTETSMFKAPLPSRFREFMSALRKGTM